MKLISDSSMAVMKIEDGSVFLVDVHAYNKHLETSSDCPHFILSKESWIEARKRVLQFGIVGFNGISNLLISLSADGKGMLLSQEKIALELDSRQVDAICTALVEEKFEYANLDTKNFTALEPTFMLV